jgi:hypothetical protein
LKSRLASKNHNAHYLVLDDLKEMLGPGILERPLAPGEDQKTQAFKIYSKKVKTADGSFTVPLNDILNCKFEAW